MFYEILLSTSGLLKCLLSICIETYHKIPRDVQDRWKDGKGQERTDVYTGQDGAGLRKASNGINPLN